MLYQWLAASNLWLLGTGLYFFAVSFIWFGRKVFEGKGYNVSLSSNLGDLFLVVMFCIGVYLLQQKQAVLPQWLVNAGQQFGLLGIITAVAAGVTWFDHQTSPKQWMDIYHNVVVLPIFLQLTIMLGLVIWLNGSGWQIAAALCCGLVWAVSLGVDIQHGLLDQRGWLKGNCPEFYRKLR